MMIGNTKYSMIRSLGIISNRKKPWQSLSDILKDHQKQDQEHDHEYKEEKKTAFKKDATSQKSSKSKETKVKKVSKK